MKIYGDNGVSLTVQQIRKTINNLRSRVKGKTDRNKTGNKLVKLSHLEQKFFEISEPTTNPTVTKLEFGCSAGMKSPEEMDLPNLTASLPSTPSPPPMLQSAIELNREASSPTTSIISCTCRKRKSLTELQRSVLEVQMKAANAQYLAAEQQRIYYEQKIKQLRVDRLQTLANALCKRHQHVQKDQQFSNITGGNSHSW